MHKNIGMKNNYLKRALIKRLRFFFKREHKKAKLEKQSRGAANF